MSWTINNTNMQVKLFATDYISACLCILLAWLILYLRKSNKKYNLPRGPFALPLLGNVLQMGKNPGRRILEWSKIYGPIFRIKMGTETVVVVTDGKMIRELYNEQATTGRMIDNPVIYEVTNGPYGVVNSSGPTWVQQRRFTLRTLRDFGFAKSSMETTIQDEALAVIRWLQKWEGQSISGNGIFTAPVVNSLWRIVAGERVEWEETGTCAEVEAFKALFVSMKDCVMNGIYFAPVLRHIAPDMLGWTGYMKAIYMIRDMFEKAIAEHKKTFDPNNLRDFLDHHILEEKNCTDPKSSFYGQRGHMNGVAGLVELFLAGSETTSNNLCWFLLYVSQHPPVQKRIMTEVDRVIGTRTPTLGDRTNMPYTEATIMETLRIRNVIPLGVGHQMLEDFRFHGYDFPKGTSILGVTSAAHLDPRVWDDPEAFLPERFLMKDGQVDRHKLAFVPFSEGKRKCLGDGMAKDTIFLFVTNILQKYQILPGEPGKQMDFEPDQGLIVKPKNFNIIFSSKKQSI